ncbi:MAG: hypothetical protein PHE57_01910, partial [Synergistales bacterium]|nr:hypothetical protein [Synergistales bacterium]
ARREPSSLSGPEKATVTEGILSEPILIVVSPPTRAFVLPLSQVPIGIASWKPSHRKNEVSSDGVTPLNSTVSPDIYPTPVKSSLP